jgi:hypothetical protein
MDWFPCAEPSAHEAHFFHRFVESRKARNREEPRQDFTSDGRCLRVARASRGSKSRERREVGPMTVFADDAAAVGVVGWCPKDEHGAFSGGCLSDRSRIWEWGGIVGGSGVGDGRALALVSALQS